MNESIPSGDNRNGATEAVDQDGNPMLFNDDVPIPADAPPPEEGETGPAAEWEVVNAWEDIVGRWTELTPEEAHDLYVQGSQSPSIMNVLRKNKGIKAARRARKEREFARTKQEIRDSIVDGRVPAATQRRLEAIADRRNWSQDGNSRSFYPVLEEVYREYTGRDKRDLTLLYE